MEPATSRGRQEEGLDLLNLYEGVYTITAIDSIGCIEDTAFTVAAEVDTDMLINMLTTGHLLE